MAHIYKGEYLDVATLYIGQKIEEGFKLIRDQMSMGDTTNTIAELTAVIRAMKGERSIASSNVYNMLETISVKLGTTNKHLISLKYLAPQPTPPPPALEPKVETPNEIAKEAAA
jgi:hypothetical protein